MRRNLTRVNRKSNREFTRNPAKSTQDFIAKFLTRVNRKSNRELARNPAKSTQDFIAKFLRTFISIFRIKMTEGLQYRIAALASSTTAIFWALIEITIYSVFYNYAENRDAGFQAGLTLKQIVTYMWLNQILFTLQPMNIEEDIRLKIVNGDIGVELIRPVSLYWYWFSKTAAAKLSPFMLRGLCVLTASVLIPGMYRISPPSSIEGFILFLLSLISAFFLCSAYAMLICAVRMSVDWGDAPTYMLMLIGGVLSGGYLPLQLWPDFMQKFLLVQPFAGYCDIPLRFYLGSFNVGDVLPALCLQYAWILIFVLAGRLLLNKKIKTIIVQGG